MPDPPIEELMAPERLAAWRAVEALRAGVPSRAAVLALGIASSDVEDRFRAQIAALIEADAEGAGPSGFLVAGDFGSGKSHLLEYLRHAALDEGLVTSKVVISKEVPLYDPAKLYRAAMESAVVPGRRGSALTHVAGQLDPNSRRYADLRLWVHSPACGLNQRFAATLQLYERVRDKDPELAARIVAFWAGDRLQTAEIRAALRECGESLSYRFDKIDALSLALQRFAFAARLMLAAGYNGWLLLIDELELVARYSLRQRAKSYAEIARWTGNVRGESYSGMISVLAITADFERAVLDDRNDRDLVPAKLRLSVREADQATAGNAERGMKLIGKSHKLAAPTRRFVDAACDKVRALYATAYAWDPPPVSSGERLASTSMREYVRRWINEWDLRRLSPGYEPRIETERMGPSYAEDEEFEPPFEAGGAG